ncbi:MAG TPA: hypothetical protein VK756_04005 [Solirubrobacteraceae bacterium]|jgi:hypothetical protein|nr:hypothetical protein [Solirubrobacteraceae bacterium]
MAPNDPRDSERGHIDAHDSERRESAALQQRALAGMRALESVRAPAALRESIEELTSSAARKRRRSGPRRAARERRRHKPRRPLIELGAGTLAAAIAAVVLVLVLGAGAARTPTAPAPGVPTPVLAGPPGATAAPSTMEAARIALAPASRAAPAESTRRPGTLAASVQGLSFPYWGGWRGWRAAGARSDRLGARTITTVFYASAGGRRIGYAIVAGRPLQVPSAGTTVARGGTRFRVLDAAGATIVTWREAGHTCVLAARGVGAGTLLSLVS